MLGVVCILSSPDTYISSTALGGNLKTGIGRPIGNSLRKSLFVKLKKLPVGFSRKRQFPAFS